MLDLSKLTVERDPDWEFEGQVERLVVDEEKLLDVIPRSSQEAIVSCLSLHWVYDLSGTKLCDVDFRNLALSSEATR
ncbi:hypothetical protein BJV78DRAFT_95799 [Lactifluus subvellereus]|nr:hypothetical protein BJV78DRAFT_95799 [Lactifluus subvellereus]